MTRADRARVATAIMLILLGLWFLAVQLVPALQAFAFNQTTWPLAVVGIGVVLAIIAVITWVPGLLVPASIVAGIGGLLYWQNLTGNWASWAYAWTLIPGFVGVGVLLSSLMSGRPREAVTGGGGLVLTSMVLFLIFGSLLGGVAPLGVYWPLLLVLLGVVLLVGGLLRKPA